MDKMQYGRKSPGFQFAGDGVRAVYLNQVQDLAAVLPLLREIRELEEVSISNKKFGDEEFKHLLPLKKLKWLNLFQIELIGDEVLERNTSKNFPDLQIDSNGGNSRHRQGPETSGGIDETRICRPARGNKITDAGLVHLKKLDQLDGPDPAGDASNRRRARAACGMNPDQSEETLRLQDTAITDAWGLRNSHALEIILRVVAISGSRERKRLKKAWRNCVRRFRKRM